MLMSWREVMYRQKIKEMLVRMLINTVCSRIRRRISHYRLIVHLLIFKFNRLKNSLRQKGRN